MAKFMTRTRPLRLLGPEQDLALQDIGLGAMSAGVAGTDIPTTGNWAGVNGGIQTTDFSLYPNGMPSVTAGVAGAETPWYQNSGMLSSYAGLGSALAAMASLPSQIDWAKTQTKALKQNIATAKEEQNRRNKNISGFNSIDASKYA